MENQASESFAYRRVIWISFALALVVYGVVAVFVFTPEPRNLTLQKWIFPLIAVGMGVGSFLVRRMMRDEPVQSDKPSLRKPELMGWIWADAIGILGLVSFFLGVSSIQTLIVYLAAALVLLVIQRPVE